MSEDTKKQYVEGTILALMIQAAHEQAFMVKDELKMNHKVLLKNWLVQGEKIAQLFAQQKDPEFIGILTDQMHETNKVLRETLGMYFEQNVKNNG